MWKKNWDLDQSVDIVLYLTHIQTEKGRSLLCVLNFVYTFD